MKASVRTLRRQAVTGLALGMLALAGLTGCCARRAGRKASPDPGTNRSQRSPKRPWGEVIAMYGTPYSTFQEKELTPPDSIR